MEKTQPTFGEVKAQVSEKRSFDIPVSGVPDIKVTDTVTVNPHRLVFTFERYYTEGEPKSSWSAQWTRVYGKRRLADGSLSEKSTHERQYYNGRNAPDWVLDQVEKYRPED